MKHSSNRSKHDLTLKLSVVLLWCILSFSRPRNGGRFCVGRRMKFRSCNTEPCPRGRKDFREEQCSQFDGKHFNINGLPPTVRWVPKYSGSEYTDIILKHVISVSWGAIELWHQRWIPFTSIYTMQFEASDTVCLVHLALLLHVNQFLSAPSYSLFLWFFNSTFKSTLCVGEMWRSIVMWMCREE